jgi:hypothetical protein
MRLVSALLSVAVGMLCFCGERSVRAKEKTFAEEQQLAVSQGSTAHSRGHQCGACQGHIAIAGSSMLVKVCGDRNWRLQMAVASAHKQYACCAVTGLSVVLAHLPEVWADFLLLCGWQAPPLPVQSPQSSPAGGVWASPSRTAAGQHGVA